MKRISIIFIFLAGIALAACHKGDVVTTDHSVKLSFERSLIEFDTVFTHIGSATLNFKVKNTNKNAVKSNISLAGGVSSFFRINVDGQPGTRFVNKEIRGGDSMYIFVEVNIDPRNQSNPFIIRDSVIFETNGNVQYVKLEAYGQDAYYLKDVGLFGTLPVDRPIVFVDYIQVPPDSTLIIPAGAKVYCHAGTIVDVYGSLQIQGTEASPVIIQGDRLERSLVYQKGPGQWQGIIFRPGSTDNFITHAIIENADFGIYDSLFGGTAPVSHIFPKTQIHNTIIRNMTLYGVVSLNSFLTMDNTLIYNTGGAAFTAWGGRYDIIHCTLDNSGPLNAFNRQSPTLLIIDDRMILANHSAYIRPVLSFHAYDDIVWGGLDDEFYIDKTNSASDTIFRKCDIKTKSYHLGKANFNTDPGYYNAGEEDYHLGKGSQILIGLSPLPPQYSSITKDIDEIDWDIHRPGCYFTTR